MLKVGVDYVYLVIGDRCWGKGPTEKEALKKAKLHGVRGLKTYTVLLVPPSARVDEMGNICWDSQETLPAILLRVFKEGKEVSLEI